MSASVSILGNLGRNPESRINAEGTFITNFSIASNSVRNTPQRHDEKDRLVSRNSHRANKPKFWRNMPKKAIVFSCKAN